jgi:hypothetical protein
MEEHSYREDIHLFQQQISINPPVRYSQGGPSERASKLVGDIKMGSSEIEQTVENAYCKLLD